MTVFKTITQGGQVHLHQLHMLKQVLVAGVVVAFIAGVGYFGYQCIQLPKDDWRMFYETTWARMMIATNPADKHKSISQIYTSLRGEPYKRSSLNILKDPILTKTTDRMEKILTQTGYRSLEFGGWAFLATMALWLIMGLSQKRIRHQRGNMLVPYTQLRSLLKRRREASKLKLGKLPLVKNKETSHMLMTGTTGSGKTNAFHILIPQIRRRRDRAIILDVTGDYISRYYDEKRDLILNPLDTRSQSWHPWADCQLDVHYDVLAESFIQTKEGNRDPFWDNASRAIFKTALRKFSSRGEEDVEKLTTFLLMATDSEFEDFFKDTEAATYSVKKNEKTTHSIRSVLASQIESLRQLEPTVNPFSIRDWVKNENLPSKKKGWPWPPKLRSSDGWLFITARPDQRQTLTPLISAWVDIALNALMVLPENRKRRLWFIIDELAALQKLPRLQAGLAEGRKYGGCVLVGFQSKPQLEEIYGRNASDTMLDLFNTKIFFRCTEPSTQKWISNVLGDKEETEPTENISYGAHSMRDGVSLSHHTHEKPLVMPTELGQLKDLECFVKLPGNLPVTKLITPFNKSRRSKKEAFLLREEKKRSYGQAPSGMQVQF